MIHSLSTQPLPAICKESNYKKIISCVSCQIFWGENQMDRRVFFCFFFSPEGMCEAIEWVTYTLISCAGCLCLEASSHLGTSAQSSSSLRDEFTQKVGHPKEQKVKRTALHTFQYLRRKRLHVKNTTMDLLDALIHFAETSYLQTAVWCEGLKNILVLDDITRQIAEFCSEITANTVRISFVLCAQ